MSNTTSFLILAAFIGLFLCLRILIDRARRNELLYEPRTVLSGPEQVLYFRLVKALPECVVLAQVELSRLVKPSRRIRDSRKRFGLYQRIRGRSLDYVVCLKDMTVVAAVELDDSSHDSERGRKRDRAKNLILQSAGIPLLRWHVKTPPTADEIRAAFSK